jgi:hypothetical protein
MYCARGVVANKKLTLCCAVLYSNLSAINHFYIENNPMMSGLWRVAKVRYFFNFFKEDYE